MTSPLALTVSLKRADTGTTTGRLKWQTAGDYRQAATIPVGMSETAIPIDPLVGTPGLLYVMNHTDPETDPDNYVDIGWSTGNYVHRVKAGEHGIIPVRIYATTIYIVASDAATEFQYELSQRGPAGLVETSESSSESASGSASASLSDSISGSSSESGEDLWVPDLPQSYVDTTYSLPTGGTTWNVSELDDLQTVLDAAQPGDVIVLQAGDTWTGNYTIADRSGTGDIYVISSALASLQAGIRVAPADAANMPKITSPDQFSPVLIIGQVASNWRFAGIEITTNYNSQASLQYTLIRVGWSEVLDYEAAYSDRIIFDRCFVHGTSDGNILDGIVVYLASNFAIVDSYISDLHAVGYESHGVAFYLGPGPAKLSNSYVQAAGINVFFADTALPAGAPIPSDIHVTGNHLHKPLSWDINDPSYAGIHWTIKNLLETKGSVRVLIESNILENCWTDAQTGAAVLLTCYGPDILDVTIRNNIILNTLKQAEWLAAAGTVMRRVDFSNNLFYTTRVTEGYSANGMSAGDPEGMSYVTFSHNTVVYANAHSGWVVLGSVGADEIGWIRMYDNLVSHGLYGLIGSGQAVGLPSIDFYAANYDVQGTVWIAGISSYHVEDPNYGQHSFPADNAAVEFVDLAFNNIPADFALAAGSPFKNSGTDSTDPGANTSLLPVYS